MNLPPPFWVSGFACVLLVFFHNIFLTHRFTIRASGIYPMLQKNIYDIVLMSWGAILFVAAHTSFAIFGFVLLVAMMHYFCVKRLLSIRVGKVTTAAALLSISTAKFILALRMRIYDTADCLGCDLCLCKRDHLYPLGIVIPSARPT